jgi:hypothetical protein
MCTMEARPTHRSVLAVSDKHERVAVAPPREGPLRAPEPVLQRPVWQLLSFKRAMWHSVPRITRSRVGRVPAIR